MKPSLNSDLNQENNVNDGYVLSHEEVICVLIRQTVTFFNIFISTAIFNYFINIDFLMWISALIFLYFYYQSIHFLNKHHPQLQYILQKLRAIDDKIYEDNYIISGVIAWRAIVISLIIFPLPILLVLNIPNIVVYLLGVISLINFLMIFKHFVNWLKLSFDFSS